MSRPPQPEQGIESGGDSIDTERLERLEAALLTLPRFRREVFLANRIDGLSFAEIAAATGASERTIEREMARAIYCLDRVLHGCEHDGGGGLVEWLRRRVGDVLPMRSRS